MEASSHLDKHEKVAGAAGLALDWRLRQSWSRDHTVYVGDIVEHAAGAFAMRAISRITTDDRRYV